MKPSYSHGTSTAFLVKEDTGWQLQTIYTPTPDRGRGQASRLLKMICQDADTEGVELQLELLSAPGTGLRRSLLQSWYGRHGFVGEAPMVRRPKKI